MRELRVILHREFVERVRSRSFVLSTLLTPLFILLAGVGPLLINQVRSGGEYSLIVVDATGGELGARVAAALSAARSAEREDRLRVQVVEGELAAVRDSLSRAVRLRQIDAYLHLPEDVTGDGRAGLWSGDGLAAPVRRRIESAIGGAVQAERLRRSGLEPEQLAAVLRPVRVESLRLTAAGEAEQSDAGLMFAVLMGFLLYMLILLFGVQVMQSVQEEKTNRIAEVLVSSVQAPHLMLGKVLGVGLAALLQVSIWIGFGAALLSERERLAGWGIAPDALAMVVGGAGPGLLVSGAVYLVLGFFLYATLFAAVGAAASSTEDAQRFTLPLVMPLFLPMVMADAIVSAPRDTLAVVLSWIPLTAPLTMPMRMGAGGATTVEAVGSVLLLAVSVGSVAWAAGKIYRIGILSTGQRASMRDIWRWVRMA